MTQPFDDKDVVYRFTPESSGITEYVILRDTTAPFGIAVYCCAADYWTRHSALLPIVAHLLKEREELMAEREKAYQGYHEHLTFMDKSYNDAVRESIKIEQERDKYKAALEQYAGEKNWLPRKYESWIGKGCGYDLARAALKKED